MVDVREYTDKLLSNCEDFGENYKDLVILSCLKYMSEEEVKDMTLSNELVEGLEDD